MSASAREIACLRVVARAGGRIDDEDEALASFVDDGDPDTLNRCYSAGTLRFTHNDLFDTGTAHLTDAGRALLWEASHER